MALSMHILFKIFLFTIFAIEVNCFMNKHWTKNTNQSCDSKSHYRYYASKTDYLVAKGFGHADQNYSTYPGCEPIKLYFFSRHAIRYPHSWDMRSMVKAVPKIRNHLVKLYEDGKLCVCENTIEQFKNWNLNMIPSQEDAISDTGRKQSHDLAIRLKKRYPGLLDISYENNSREFEFHYSSKRRAFQTAEAFASGLSEELPSIYREPNDNILQFHVKCDEIMMNKGWSREMHLEEATFINGTVMKSVLRDLSDRLHYNITYDEAFMVFQTCAFEFAMHGSSIWCTLFAPRDIKAFEYVDDLRDYYNDGFGHHRNYGQACPAIGHLVKYFRQGLKGDELLKAMLMFSHGKALKKITTSLELFKDENPLFAHEYEVRSDRKWRSSFICPFNANLVFVLYKCDDDDSQFRVETLFNEKPVQIKGCSSKLCPWTEFEATYGPVADNCDFDSICSP